MITEDKVIELFCFADDFCKFFDRMVAKDTFKNTIKRSYHRNSTMSKANICVIYFLSLFHITVSLSWKGKLQSHWHCSSKRSF